MSHRPTGQPPVRPLGSASRLARCPNSTSCGSFRFPSQRLLARCMTQRPPTPPAPPARQAVARPAPAPSTTRPRPTRALGDPGPHRWAPVGPTGPRHQRRAGRVLGAACGLLGDACGPAELSRCEADDALEVLEELALIREADARRVEVERLGGDPCDPPRLQEDEQLVLALARAHPDRAAGRHQRDRAGGAGRAASPRHTAGRVRPAAGQTGRACGGSGRAGGVPRRAPPASARPSGRPTPAGRSPRPARTGGSGASPGARAGRRAPTLPRASSASP